MFTECANVVCARELGSWLVHGNKAITMQIGKRGCSTLGNGACLQGAIVAWGY